MRDDQFGVFIIDPKRLDALMRNHRRKTIMFNDAYFQAYGFESRASWLNIAATVYAKDANQVLAINAQAELAGADDYFSAFDVIANGGIWD